MKKINIYTSYYANINKIPENIIKISISILSPKGYKGLEYTKIAPKYNDLIEWKEHQDEEYYIAQYNKNVLSLLNPLDVYSEIKDLSGGKDCVLLCYEKPEDFCHRHLFADWINKKLRLNVSEWEN